MRRRLRLPAPVVTATAAAAPIALCVLHPRSRRRDVATCALQMWAYVATYQMPHDDPAELEERVHVGYPVVIDRALGLGRMPNLRLQRLLSRPGRITALDKLLIWAHWIWFLVPHSALLWILFRRRAGFERSALMIYGVFDIGAGIYWLVPTAPPWYAHAQGRFADPEMPELRRLMYEHGEAFWKGGWRPLYDFLGGNPLAAMPSLHFATSLMAAHMLAEAGPIDGAVGWAYTSTLALALVYLGEHYVVDLLAGLALTEAVRRHGPRAAPLLQRLGAGIHALELRARAA